jgi:tetratricopeptide (TPR) repeat protein
MMTKEIILYGYRDETKLIEAAVDDLASLRFVCLTGVGGIGKSTMLRSFQKRYGRKRKRYAVTGLLDFDDLRLHILQNILHELASQLRTTEADFGAYFKAAAQLREMQNRGSSLFHIEEQEEQVMEAFMQGFHALSQTRRSLILFDTLEKVQDLALWRELVQVLVQLDNTAVLLVGRRGDQVDEYLQERISSPASSQVISLQGLSHQESLTYFKRTELGEFLAEDDPQQTQIVCWLSNGRPILIDLAVDWLGRGIKLDTPTLSAKELDKRPSREETDRFERRLVERVNDLSKPENEAILDMAHIHHYFDAHRHSFLHSEFSLQESEQLLEKLHAFSFVKLQPGGGIRLHDEMQRMVSEYAWPVLDKSGSRRRWLSQRMVQYCSDRLANGDDDLVARQALATEQLFHCLYADINEGHQAFLDVFRDAMAQHQLGYAQVLLNTLEEFSPRFDQKLQAWDDIHKGRLLRAREQVQGAVALIRPAKERLQELGVEDEIDTVCNVLGYCYRLSGHWQQAISAYEEALFYSRKEDDARQIAETLNNIANTCRLGGDYERANRCSLVSLKIRERLDDKRAIGNSCRVRAMICWETGNTIEAADYLKRARQLFTEIMDVEGVAEADKYESYMRFRTGDLDGALPLLKQAQELFSERGASLSLADSLNLEARILISQLSAKGETGEGFREVEDIAQRALVISRRIRDYFKMAECRLTLCRIYQKWGRLAQAQGDAQKAQDMFRLAREQYDSPEGGQSARQRNYLSIWSVYEWTMGDIAYEAGDWEVAFDHYLQECATASRFKDARFARALNALSDRLHRLPEGDDHSHELTRLYCDYVIDGWREQGLARDHPELIEECEYIKEFLQLGDPRRLDQLRQWGADLLIRGEWQRAVEVFDELMTAEQIHNPGESAAEAMTQSAWAHRQMGAFVQARRLCQQGLLIRQKLGDPAAIAGSRLVMGTIMWITGNTDEAARYLRLARGLYRQTGEELGLARAYRHTAFMHFRIGDHKAALRYVTQAEDIFRQQKRDAELADALNLHAVILRRERLYDEARELGQESRRLAEESGAHYTLAEAWLTLGLIEYADGQAHRESDPGRARDSLERAKGYREKGYHLAKRHGYDLLLSVFESVAGMIAFDEGRYAAAFEHYVRDLRYGARFGRARIRRELDRIVDRWALLPKETRRFYADYMIMEWQEESPTADEPDTPRMFHLLKEYNDYV